MTIADVLAGLMALILVGLGFPALLTLLSLIFPLAVEQAAKHISAKPLRAFGQGMLAFIGTIILAGFLKNAMPGPGKLLSLLMLLGSLSLAMVGGAGLVRFLSEKLNHRNGSNPSLQKIFLSTLLIEFSAIVPFVGWFVFLPITFLMMLGTGYAILFHRQKPSTISGQPPVFNHSFSGTGYQSSVGNH